MVDYKKLVLWVGLGLAVVVAGFDLWGKVALGTIHTILLFMAGILLLLSVAWKKLQDGDVSISDLGNGIMIVFGILVLIAALVSVKFITIELPAILLQLASISVIITGFLIAWNGIQVSK